MEKKGVSEIVTTILIILLVFAAVIIFWNIYNNLIKGSAEDIDTSVLQVSLEIQEAKVWVTGGADVKIFRNTGGGDIDELKFLFETEDGSREIISRNASDHDMPDELETKVYNFSSEEINQKVEKISVVSSLKTEAGKTKTGITVSELESSIRKEDNGERIPDDPEPEQINNLGLVSWWKFDGNADDSIGGNNGIVNGVSFVSDNSRQVAEFDGIDDYVEINSLIEMDINRATFSFWSKRLGSDTHDYVFKGNTPASIYFHSTALDIRLRTAHTASNDWCIGNPFAEQNNWNHYAFSCLNKTCIVYENSPILNTCAVLLNNTLDIKQIGQYFNGSIDEVMIFNKSLSENEISAIYNNQKK